jgi:hypothetical protein
MFDMEIPAISVLSALTIFLWSLAELWAVSVGRYPGDAFRPHGASRTPLIARQALSYTARTHTCVIKGSRRLFHNRPYTIFYPLSAP